MTFSTLFLPRYFTPLFPFRLFLFIYYIMNNSRDNAVIPYHAWDIFLYHQNNYIIVAKMESKKSKKENPKPQTVFLEEEIKPKTVVREL